MQFTDKLSEHYDSLLTGKYDCVDRIVLNGYCPMLLTGGGVRYWYRTLKGDDKDLDTNALMRFAGRMSRRVQAVCKAKKIPFTHYKTGERKHEDAVALIPADKSFTGIFAIFCSLAPTKLWEVKKFTNNIDIRRKKSRFIGQSILLSHYR